MGFYPWQRQYVPGSHMGGFDAFSPILPQLPERCILYSSLVTAALFAGEKGEMMIDRHRCPPAWWRERFSGLRGVVPVHLPTRMMMAIRSAACWRVDSNATKQAASCEDQKAPAVNARRAVVVGRDFDMYVSEQEVNARMNGCTCRKARRAPSPYRRVALRDMGFFKKNTPTGPCPPPARRELDI